MVRTQIQLTETQSSILQAMAREKRVSIAELIRRSVDTYILLQKELTVAEKYERLWSIVGKYATAETDISSEHDRYLAEIYGDFAE